MKKPLALAALAAMILVGAAYPDADKPDGDDAQYSERDDRAAPRTYRPCRSRSDDNCIQLNERGVRESYARWLRDGDPNHQPVRVARARYRSQHAAAHRAHGQRAHHTMRAQPRQVAHARPHRAAYAQTRTRCVPIARRPAARSARAAPPPAPRAWQPAARPQRPPEDSGVRGM
jgi:hypothetical protein